MKHLRFNYRGKCYILTGDCITVYDDNGNKLKHRFFADCESAFLEFSNLYTSLTA